MRLIRFARDCLFVIAALANAAALSAEQPSERSALEFERTTATRGGVDWWSLQPIAATAPPSAAHAEAGANPIDAFILARLKEAGLEPAPLASRRDLIRRAYYDVIGLPPTYEQIKAFEEDGRDDAWSRVVDELLASPHFGERWARHWLDVVRFAETCGYERDQEKPFAWRYRDWVVGALNQDMPYDRFVLEQLAGDELPDRCENSVIATGFLMLGAWNDEPNDPQDYKYERMEDLVHATSSAFLGLTVKCARCHDHKFDPITQTDYYRIAAAFWPGPIEPRDANLLGGPTAQELGYENVLGWTDLGNSAEPLRLLKNGERHQPGEIVVAGPLSAVGSMEHAFTPSPKDAATTTRRLQLARWIVDAKNPLTARVQANRIWLRYFGDGLVRTPDNFGIRGERPTHPELLDWLADALIQGEWRTKRVHKLILLSRTYRQGSAHPSHAEYVEQDGENRLLWRANRRRLDAEALRDSMLTVGGELDSTIGGPSFRASVSPEALEGLSRKDAAWTASPPDQQLRRSLYMFTQRGLLPPMMTTFNFCDTVSPCGKRDVTTAPTQALALLNSAFSNDRSKALAERVANSSDSEPEARITCAWRVVFGRSPTATELELAEDFIAEQRARVLATALAEADSDRLALESLCHVLINANEFVYLD